MFVRANHLRRRYLLGGSAVLALVLVDGAARAQTVLPEVVVSPPKENPKPRRAPVRAAPKQAPSSAAVTPPAPPATPADQLNAKADTFDQARNNLYTTIGTTSDVISHPTIDALPGGDNTPVERILLQAPGVTQDSAASGLLHVRNDHANVQFRINGVMLPDGLTGFGSILDASWIGSMSLVTGALPAEFGLRTVGLVDITTRADIFNNSGLVGAYGGSQAMVTPTLQYGGTFGSTCPTVPAPAPGTHALPSADCFPGVQYFFTGRYLLTDEGLENSTAAYSPIHDFSQQEKGFAYMSTFVDPNTRVSLIAGTATNAFQIPNVPGQQLFGAFNGLTPPIPTFNSALLNENQYEDTQYGVLALQRSIGGFDGQISYFTRYDRLHFAPDPVGDLLINGVASDIVRESWTNGIQADGSYQINPGNTLRAGFFFSGEQAFVGNSSLVAQAPAGVPIDPLVLETINDNVSTTGYLAGVYMQDEWKVTDKLTINGGLRFDQMWQFVDANQLSPRISFTYTPFEFTKFHFGYARYFTPPVLVEAAPANIALFNNTTGASTTPGGTDPVLPERSHYFDAGIDQNIPFGCSKPTAKDCTDLDLSVDAYYKLATDLIDNGNFGQALVLSAFNYARGVVEGIEFSGKFHSGNFQAYANVAVGREMGTDVVSNQYLFDNLTPLPDLGGMTLRQYVDSHWIYTDHTQILTASAGGLYQFCGRPANANEALWASTPSWCGTKLSADMIYGSGLRNGDANISTVPAYTQFNVGVGREFLVPNDSKPMTVRFDVVNLFDTVYQIRSGTGIGVFAPQYGPRRGYFLGVSKKF